MDRVVKRHVPDAWINTPIRGPQDGEVGYEINFTRHFFQPTHLYTLEEIRADIPGVEKEAEGLLDGLMKTKLESGS